MMAESLYFGRKIGGNGDWRVSAAGIPLFFDTRNTPQSG